MAEYFETEETTKGYDPDIFRRILSYLKPYRAGVAVAVAALVVSTAGELFLPLLIQRVVDETVIPDYRMVRSAAAAGSNAVAAVSRLTSDPATRRFETAEGLVSFVPRSALGKLARSEERALSDSGVLDEAGWYVVRYSSDDRAAGIVGARPALFVTGTCGAGGDPGGLCAAIRLDDLASLPSSERLALRSGDVSALGRWAVIFCFVLLAVLAATFAQTFVTNQIGQRVMKDMRLELYDRTASQSLAFLSRHPVGRLVTRLTGDVETINQFFTEVLVAFLKDLAIMAGALVVLARLSPALAVVTFLSLPPVFIVTGISRVKARDAFRKQRSAVSRVNAYLSERLSGIQVVQLFAQEERSGKEFSERNADLLKANLDEMYVFAAFRPVVDFLASATTVVVVIVGAWLYFGQSISIGVLVAFINLVGMFYSPLKDIAEKYTMLQSAMAGGERVFKLLDADERIPDAPVRALPASVAGRIEFDEVRFGYKAGEEVIKGLSFSVESGEMVAIVGYTGAGKTTITNLIARLWDVDGGTILLDGIPIKDLPLADLRRSIAPVLQDVFLFSGSVADNIKLGLPLSDEEVELAARAVYAHDFIAALPEGYATMLSEGATNISSGQRQLISFARVVAHDPRIVILDEATSSVDTETERLIKLGMDRILSGRTSIVIAHRLSTIKHADRILVLSDGRLVESGTNEELLARNGLYANLYRLQYERGTP